MQLKVEKDWTTKVGFRAVVIMTSLGHRCGYVGVDSSHPLYGIGHRESSTAIKEKPTNEGAGKRGIIPLVLQSADPDGEWSLDVVFDVHGSLTFSGPRPYDKDLWWFGFDTGHANDAPDLDAIEDPGVREFYERMEFMHRAAGDMAREHRTLDYMVEECESLAQQLIDRCV